MRTKNILVLGGGFGGLATVNELKRLLPAEWQVTLIEKKKKFSMGLANLWLMVGERKNPEECEKEIAGLEKKGVKFVNEEVVSIDPENRYVKTIDNAWEADYIVIALGAELSPADIPGFEESSLNLYDLYDAYKIQKELESFKEGRIVILITRTPFKCPAAPYEAAFLINSYLKRRGIRDNIEIEIYTPEFQPMPVAGKEVGSALENMLHEQGIGYYTEQSVLKIDGKSKTVIFETEETRYDLLIGVPPHKAPKVVKDAGLVDATGWIPVDPYTMKTKYEGIFAIGDITSIKLKNGMFLPKAGVFAESQGKVVAHNIAAEIRGEEKTVQFEGYGYCYIDVGEEKAAYAAGNFYKSPAPEVKLEPPSEKYKKEKEEFEKMRIESWL